MSIIIKNQPKAFTEKEIIDSYHSASLFQVYRNKSAEGKKEWYIDLDLIYMEGYDVIGTDQIVITRYVNDAEG